MKCVMCVCNFEISGGASGDQLVPPRRCGSFRMYVTFIKHNKTPNLNNQVTFCGECGGHGFSV